MMPATGGVIRDPAAPMRQAEITVTGAILDQTTTVLIQEWFVESGHQGFIAARIVLDEQDRRELIELLGGTP